VSPVVSLGSYQAVIHNRHASLQAFEKGPRHLRAQHHVATPVQSRQQLALHA